MQIPTDTDLTLDSIPAFAPCSYAAQELVLTILFHPDTTRIGQRVEVPKLVGNAPWVLGRRGPAFQAPGDDRSIALEDGHISRRALQLIYNGKALTIRRFDSSSRCRVGSSELYDRVELNAEQLQAGVPMLLGHSIVLMLRLALIESSALQKHDDDERLRGKSAAMGRVRDQISSAAQSDLDVPIRRHRVILIRRKGVVCFLTKSEIPQSTCSRSYCAPCSSEKYSPWVALYAESMCA